MNALKNFLVAVVLSAAAFGVYMLVTGKPASDPPKEVQAALDEGLSVELPDADFEASTDESATSDVVSKQAGPPPRFSGQSAVEKDDLGSDDMAATAPPFVQPEPPAGDDPTGYPTTDSGSSPLDAPPEAGDESLHSASAGSRLSPDETDSTADNHLPDVTDRYGRPLVRDTPYGTRRSDESSVGSGEDDSKTVGHTRRDYLESRQQIQELLESGRLAEAHLELSRWYTSSDLIEADREQVTALLDRLTGTVVYSQEHLLEPPYEIQRGDTLELIAKQYQVPWEILAKINGLDDADRLPEGESLKVIRGPFRAVVDVRNGRLTLWLGERYAGRFEIGAGAEQTAPPGEFQVKNKVANPTYYGRDSVIDADDPENPLGELAIDLGDHIWIHGSQTSADLSEADPRGCVRLSARDMADVYDMLAVGSTVVIR